MPDITIRRGHDLRLSGRPRPEIASAPRPARVALQPADFRYLRLRLRAQEGQEVLAGTPLLESKEDPRIRLVSPASGRLAAVHYGERRKILEVIVELSGEERSEEMPPLSPEQVRAMGRRELIDRLCAAGLWPLIRQRPFSRVAEPDGEPKALFVGAMATEPFGPDPDVVLQGQEEAFQLGLDALRKLAGGRLHLCVARDARSAALTRAEGVVLHRFAGPHPAGNVAVQIYHVDPPKAGEVVWYLGAQDVLAVARQLTTGRFPAERVVSLCGPGIRPAQRRYYRAPLGASVESLTQGRAEPGEMRHVSGGVLTGRKVTATGFLGFYDTTLYVLPEGRRREMLAFLRPGFGKYSLWRTFPSGFAPAGEYVLDTNKRGSLRNFIMNGVYEDVCPVDILPQYLAKSVLAGDVEEAERHGILDCAECGLCSFVCPSKIEVAAVIRDGIDQIAQETFSAHHK